MASGFASVTIQQMQAAQLTIGESLPTTASRESPGSGRKRNELGTRQVKRSMEENPKVLSKELQIVNHSSIVSVTDESPQNNKRATTAAHLRRASPAKLVIKTAPE